MENGEKAVQTEEEILASLDPLERKKLEAQIGTGEKKQKVKFILGKTDEKINIEKDSIHKKETIFFKNLQNCEVSVKARSAKILIESCHNTVFHLNSMIFTNTIEIWKCNGSSLFIDCRASTIQADLCNTLNIEYSKKELMDRIVWCAMEDLNVGFKIPEEHQNLKFSTGFQQMKAQIEDLNRDIDQFIIRILDDKIHQEQIVRLPGGFPTTEREAQEFDARKSRNDEKLEKHLRKLIRTTELKHGTKQKIGRNDKCPCNSGKKYKVCCGKPGASGGGAAPEATNDKE